MSLQGEFPDVGFFALDVDIEANHPILNRYEIMSLPTLICFVNGTAREVRVSLKQREGLRERLQALLTVSNP